MTKEELKNIPNTPGIYCIKNLINNKLYIGQSINLKCRLRAHINNHLHKRHVNRHLYRAMKKYGIENFEISILAYVNNISDRKELKNELNKLEIYYVQTLHSYGSSGYNETKGGESKVGWDPSSNTKLKISIGNKQYAEKRKKELLEKHLKGIYDKSDYYNAEHTVAINIITKEKFEGFSRTHVADQINKKYNLTFNTGTISQVILGKEYQVHDFVFGNTEEECLEKISKLNLQDNPKLIHSNKYAPNYKKYLEYLISICDKKGYIPSNKELGIHFNRKPSTISGWNNKIREELELDITYNRLKLKNYTNPNIHYELKLSLIKHGNNI